MPFKPGRPTALSGEGRKPRGIEEVKPLSDLRPVLNQTKTSTQNNPLYQFLNSLLQNAINIISDIYARLTALEDATTDTSSSSTTELDYVVLSDGATPTPSPVNDGFGNFIYISYEP